MDAQTFVAYLLPLRGEEAERFIAEHAAEVDDLDAAAQLLKDEAKAQETRDLDTALAYADLIMTLADWTKAPGHRALALLEHANILLLKGYHREAIAFLDTAGEAFLAAGDEIGWARTRISYLYCVSMTGLTEAALQEAERAIAIFNNHGEPWRAVDMQINVAIALEAVGRYQEALATYNRALTACDVSDIKEAPGRKALALMNKASVLLVLGDLQGSLNCQQEAHEIFTEQGQSLAAAKADSNQALFLTGLGQYSAALHLYHRAREYYRQHALPNWTALTAANMADCLLRLNRASEALRLAEEAVTIYCTLDETLNLGWAFIYLARAQAACGQVAVAIDTLEEARQRFEGVGAFAATGLVLLTVADLLLVSKQAASALVCVEQALAIFHTHQMESWITEAHLLQGRAYEAHGDREQALALASLACEEARRAQLPWLEFGAEHLLGRLSQQSGNLEAAERHYQTGLNLLEGLMTWLVRDQRSTFLLDKEGVFSALIGLSLDKQDMNGALEYLERLKSQVLREYLTRSADIRLKASDPDEARLLEELQRLRQELHWYSSQIASAEGKLPETLLGAQPPAMRGTQGTAVGASPELEQQKREQLRREQAISELLERVFLQHESSSFDSLPLPGAMRGSLTQKAPVSVEHLAALLRTNDVLLEYFFQGDDLLIFSLHAKQRQAEVTRVPGATASLSKLLPLFRANINMVARQLTAKPGKVNLDQALEANAQGLSRKLYDVLVHPVESHIPPDGRLLLVPYGALHTLPFHALYDGQRYLIERCEIAYLASAAMLHLQEIRHSTSKADAGRSGRALVLGHSDGGRLPYTLQEARRVAALLKSSSYLEEQATTEKLSSSGGSHAIIHLAAHGKNRTDAPDFSYLQLDDGQLNTVDVFNLDLPAELVTLSGCETGLVTIGGGDELLGLSRGFLYAGARSLLISLWLVEDASTAQLMEKFYQGVLEGQSRAGALRNAQRALLTAAREGSRPPGWAHPYFWAPFRLLGAAGPIIVY
jgi:CHAT domain-containing protein